MNQPDPVIHQPVRLRLMAMLEPLPRNELIEFVRLRKILDTSEGNLSLHLQTLEQAGYVVIEKDFADNRPRTRVKLTRQGRAAYGFYIDFLREIVADYSAA
ncbi:MAG TPA: transcriptional regulator [Rhizomicrobium sp.]|nr:transcriptional regulator [Rhizomicrobium sp.]